MTTPASLIRGIPIQPLEGIYTLECEVDNILPILLRTYELDANGNPVDTGALALRNWDPANQAPNSGSGYACHLRDAPGGNLLATGTVTQNGVRAADNFSLPGALAHDYTTVITYPDLRDETVAPPTITRTFTWKDPATAAPSAAGHLYFTGTATDDRATLIDAINGTTDYGDGHVFHGTEACLELLAVATAGSTLSLEGRDGGRWGNLVTWEFFDNLSASVSSGSLTLGTGTRGLTLEFDHAVLPNSLVPSDSGHRYVYADIVGLDENSDPTKLLILQGDLHRTNTF